MRIDVAGHIMYFGMTAVGIFQRLSRAELDRIEGAQDMDAKELAKQVDPMRSFAFIVYGALCNNADMQEQGIRPAFEDAYIIADSLSDDDQTKVWQAFENSRAGSELIAKLPKGEKKSPVKTNLKRQTRLK